MDTVDIGESIMSTIKSAKVLYSLSIWSLAIVCILKIMSMPSSDPTKSALYNRTQLLELNLIAGNGSDNTAPDYDDFVHDVETRLPSLPFAYWSKHQTQLRKKSSTCAKHPSLFELEFNNIYWQTLRSSNGTFQLFGAYYDTRAAASQQGPTVRILGMLDRIEPKVKTFCQFWYADAKNSTIVPTLEYRYMWVKQWGNYKQGIYQPYLITCRLPMPKDANSSQLAPSSVSLVEKKCDRATNNLRVINNRRAADAQVQQQQQQQQKKKGFVVCVKGLDFLYEDLSVRLVEWIELLLLLGADKISFYKLQVHPNIAKVLEYYERKGRVQVTPLTLPGGQPNLPGFQHLYLKRKPGHKRLDELIPYNDCLYKHMYLYDYVTLLDIDEVIMPTAENISDWQTMMAQLKALPQHNKRPQGYDSYHFRNVYFLDDQQTGHGWQADVPRYMHMLQHVYRTQNYSRPGAYVKSFHSTERVLTLHNHFPRSCLHGGCRSFAVNTTMAQMQHYRADCVNELKNSCAEIRDNAIEDTTIWKFKQPLIERVTQSLFELNFLH